MNILLGSIKFLVPGRPAVCTRSLLSSIRCEDLDDRVRLEEPDTFIVNCDAADVCVVYVVSIDGDVDIINDCEFK